ncbi:hypothetical protein XH83_27755 [Bradyrhizobium sp. CCBAU 53351]|uniref:hypothetical protein n=1 Tax=Bradyrhizobium sp. CCBAU 53351 TaxID=1325114 RepID=UPI001887FF8B|nr:hypothetical protein [Bradyrhizobium sp. CCBAU 53351]QOZ78865.1 hypothetical protein XH83_27755 [Bradyrhizobium sp. CCBAU 53351]
MQRAVEDLDITEVVHAVRDAVRPAGLFSFVRDTLHHPRNQVARGDWEKRMPKKKRNRRSK